MFCKNCGKPLGMEDKFCANCGTKVVVETPKVTEPEPMFFVEKREEPVQEKKQKKVIHLDEFNWDLDGYPTTPRKTEAVDFDWASVLEEKARRAAPKPVEPVVKELDPLDEIPKTVEDLLAALPEGLLEVVEEPEEEQVEPVAEEVPAEEVEAEEPVEDAEDTKPEEEIEEVKSLEQIIEDFGGNTVEEPTRLIDKAQMKADSVESFYMFSRKQAEYQNLLDQEYDRIQNSLLEPEEDAFEGGVPVVEEILAAAEAPEETVETTEEVVEEPAAELVEEEVVEEIPAEDPIVEDTQADDAPAEEEAVEPAPAPVVEVKELRLVAVVWSVPPAGILVEREKPVVVEEEIVEDIPVEAEVSTSEDVAAHEPVEETEEAVDESPAEEQSAEETAEATEEEVSEKTEEPPVKETITFADIFNDDDEDDEEEGKGGGCLRFIAIVLVILVILELGILGVQYFAPDSEAADFINRTYGKVVSLINGETEPADTTDVEEVEGPSETAALIEAQREKNDNILAILENKELTFETGKEYGYDELSSAYIFKNSPWYETEDGDEVTYGDAIIGTLIQYYSALPDKINDKNNDVLDFVDNTTGLYEELDEMDGDETRGYVINRLEIGEIKTGENGFYVLVNVTSGDKLQPEETTQTQLVYLEVNPTQKVIKIKETKNI